MGLIEWFLSIVYKIKTYPFVIQVTALLTMVFFISILVLAIGVQRIRRKEKRRKKIIDNNVPKIKKLFEDILFSDKIFISNEIFDNFKDIVKKINNKSLNIAIGVLVDFKNKNKKSQKYSLIIKSLNISEHIEKKFDSSSNTEKMSAFQEAFVLDLNKFDSKVLYHAYSKNKRIRNEARNSHLAISSNDPYRFFDDFDGTLTKWDEIELMQYLKLQNTRGNLDGLGKWINYSKSESLVVFLIKMVGFFKQKGINDILLEKLEDDNASIRAESILTLGELNLKDTEPTLIERYYIEPEICQIAIIKTIKKFNTGKSLFFLQEIFKESNNTDTKKIIIGAILNYGHDGKIAFENFKNSLKGFDLTILKHVETPLIKFK